MAKCNQLTPLPFKGLTFSDHSKDVHHTQHMTVNFFAVLLISQNM